ncbi:hypothetical protein [Nonomuraea jiangxiensis]|uniref:Uncharacterized protein n=1 Tax=Nonomuraea jiangxiensis TaxID=633440 RepID=A0A1G9VHB5_9ACTN|nr:hypothetical protein [Nonomuraea jiangxiensis]SDM71500.1 hypothetical protein SAMN05421869_15327 [Nonomuraea jiangxiensis]
MEYALADAEITHILLDHPLVRGQAADHRRRGVDIATAAVHLLARNLPPEADADMPLPRAAALVTAARDLPNTLTPRGEVRFLLAEPNGHDRWVDVSQIPLPDGTPEALDVAL